MTPLPRIRLLGHLGALGRIVGLGLFVFMVLVVVRLGKGARHPGQPERNLAEHIRERYGLRVLPSEVTVAGGVPTTAAGALRPRHVFFLGRAHAGAPRDVYWIMARITPAGVPVETRTLVNLSQTPNLDEDRLVHRGPYLAFPIYGSQGVGAVAIIDVTGDHPVSLRGKEGLHAWPGRVTNLQEHGHWRGFARHSLEPREPASQVTLRFVDGARLEAVAHHATGTSRAVLDCVAARLTEGARGWAYQPPMKGDKPLFNWLVDTVRNLPFVGPKKIEWLEVKVYSLWDLVRRGRGRVPDSGAGEKGAGGGAVAEVSSVGHEPYRPVPGALQASGWPPFPLVPLAPRAHSMEGQWVAPPRSLIHFNPDAPPPILETFVHPDPERSYSGVGILIWDPRQVTLGMVAGTREPLSSTGLRGWGTIPRDQHLGRVIAAFNGGFQTMHGDWGMQERGRLIREPARWAATVATDRSGDLLFGTWEGVKEVPPEIFSLRQNLAPLIEDDVVNPLRNTYWGLAVRAEREKIHIVRSGVCLTAEGFGAYLWGQAVSLATLAKAMQMARCQYGMQMDINKTNASLELYRVVPRSSVSGSIPEFIARGGRTSWGLVPGSRDWVFYAQSWLGGMYTAPFPRYIRQDWRDFMYLSLKPILPGPPLAPIGSPPLLGEGRWSTVGLPQGEDPFPPRVAVTHLGSEQGLPAGRVELVKLDPRRMGYLLVTSVGASDGIPDVERALGLLLFGSERPLGLQVGDQVSISPAPGTPALLVEGWREGDLAPSARIGTFGSTPEGRRCLLAVAADPLGEGRTDQAPEEMAEGRASALGLDEGGHVCYVVTGSGRGAGRRLARALAHAGCGGGLRLPDSPARGPLVMGPTRGRLKLLPGDRPGTAPGLGVAFQWSEHSHGRRIGRGLQHRPDRVQFSISRQARNKLRSQRAPRKSNTN